MMSPAKKPKKSGNDLQNPAKDPEIDVVNPDPKERSVLIVAPHGFVPKEKGQTRDDIYTGEIAREVANKIGCKALINWHWKKQTSKKNHNYKIRNYNKISEAEKDTKFIAELKAAAKGNDNLFVLWIHGAENDAIEKEEGLSNPEKPLKEKPLVHAVLGYGQRENENDDSTLTADRQIVESFVATLRSKGINTISASPTITKGRKTKCANQDDNMCQWFRICGYPLDHVQSLQLEIKYTGFRNNDVEADKTAGIIEKALRKHLGINPPVPATQDDNAFEAKPEEEVDEELVEQAFQKISEIMAPRIYEAMTEVGDYLIKAFYGSHERALNRKPLKHLSLNRLIERLYSTDKAIPGKSWIYNAVRLAVDEHYLDKERLSTRGKYSDLSRTIRVNLTHVRNWDTKKMLAGEALDNDYTVMKLRERINEEKTKHQDPKIPLDKVLPKRELLKYEIPVLQASGQQAKQHKEHHKKKMAHFEKVDGKIRSAINDKKALGNNPDTEHKNLGFKEWTVENINICTGCLNDCVYCYAKDQAYRRGQVESGRWPEQTIRQKDVDAPRKLHHNKIGFPSTHDINDANLDAYLIVLGKLLKAGNEILIVSKPRLNCIKRICDVTEFFKDEIMFRFTIGAMDDNVLTLWEPNAPAYAERKEALKFAYENGFQTSVSVEPMLDSPNIDGLIGDLLPYVNDAIWIGMMNHLGRIQKQADENITNALETIKANQTDERLLEIYNRHKDNPKIKWKSSIKQVVGLKQSPAPGMDV